MARNSLFIARIAQLGEAEAGKGPVDLFPVERPAKDGRAGVSGGAM
ncbi:MAG: hypothetical protein GXP09_03220 [Gammaproteobacteria bacterium]|nr:hypothetical protein [Gammaproteobacteria bacterium]